MATEAVPSTTGTDTGQQQQQDQQQAVPPETGVQDEQQQASAPVKPIELPDDHPLVKELARQKTNLATQKSELAELRATSAKATQLEAELKARPSKEAVDTLQTRYDRLEAFLQAAGGQLGRALDSRTFTTALFETNDDIADIVKKWNVANPTATSTALGSGAAAPADKAPDLNTLLRAAVK